MLCLSALPRASARNGGAGKWMVRGVLGDPGRCELAGMENACGMAGRWPEPTTGDGLGFFRGIQPLLCLSALSRSPPSDWPPIEAGQGQSVPFCSSRRIVPFLEVLAVLVPRLDTPPFSPRHLAPGIASFLLGMRPVYTAPCGSPRMCLRLIDAALPAFPCTSVRGVARGGVGFRGVSGVGASRAGGYGIACGVAGERVTAPGRG